ncbi:MAG: hypothetical protein PHN42_01175 [Bacilli bacterium]|nr:hypothetical protein [Bacilli bacterium]
MNKKLKLEINEYYFDLLNDYLFFSKDINKDLNEIKDILLQIDYLNYFDNHLDKIFKNSIYPSDIVNNINQTINYIGKLIEKDKEREDYDILKGIYYRIYGRFLLNKINNSYEIYYNEFAHKFNDLDFYLKNNYQIIYKETIEKSLRFDFTVMQSYFLDSNNFINSINDLFSNNPYYLLSIKKFLYDFPKIFLDDKIKKRTINVLEYNIALCEEARENKEDNKYLNFINENKELIERIKKVNIKSMDNSLDIIDFKQIFNITIIKKIIASNIDLEKSEFKNYIVTEEFMEFLNVFIDKSYEYIGNSDKHKINELIDFICEQNNTEIIKIKTNELKTKMQQIKLDNVNMYRKESTYKKKIHELVIDDVINYIYEDLNTELAEEEMRFSIHYDYEVIKAYICDEEEFIKKIKKKIFIDENFLYTMNLFLDNYPSLFSSKKILNRTLTILYNNIHGEKDENFNSLVKENKKMLKKIKKLVSC